MRTLLAIGVAVGLVIGLGGPRVMAEHHEHGEGAAHTHGEAAGAAMSEGGMCGQCQHAMGAVGAAVAKIQQARQSTDPAQVQALLTEAEGSLTELQTHLTTCKAKMGGKAKGGMCPMCGVEGVDGKCPECGMKI